MPGEGLTHGPPAEKNAGGSHHRISRSSGIPCAMVLTLIRALLGVPGFLATVAQGVIQGINTRELSASIGAPGPHDFTSATMPPVKRPVRVHRIPASHIVTTARTPLPLRRDVVT
jgi:hypothetical protein